MSANTKKPPKWRRFEDLVAAIQREITPLRATVTQDEKLLGRYSKTKRQIDVLVRVPTESGDLLLVIDAKDHARRLDVKHVEEFIGMVDDVGANKAALVSPLGFTKAALRRAEAAGVDALTAVDVESGDWPTFVSIPVLVDESTPDFDIRLRSLELCASPLAIHEIRLVGPSGEPLGTPLSIAIELWEQGTIDPEVAEHELQTVRLHHGSTYLKEHGCLRRVDVDVTTRVTRTLFFGEVPLTDLRGFALGDSNRVATKAFSTDWLRFDEVDRNWRRLSSRSDLGVEPFLTVIVVRLLSGGHRTEAVHRAR